MDIKMMELLLVTVSVCLFYTGLVNGEDTCMLEKATKCYNHREAQFTTAMTGTSGDPAQTMRTLCLTQVMDDQAGVCFDTSTENCRAGEHNVLKSQWDLLNNNITKECLVECHTMKEIASCKNITDASRLRFGVFERFCRTFNQSLQCVNSNLATCNFGMPFYEHMLESSIRQYWAYICNSGCENIDQTIGVIVKCSDYLKLVKSQDNLCEYHNMFKECVANATEVCSEVMVLVRVKYKKYDLIENLCKQRAISTTASTTESTTESATMPLAEAGFTTDINIPEIEDISEYKMLIMKCVDQIDHNNWIIPTQLTVDHVLLLLRLEACVYNHTTTPEVWKAKLVDHMSPEFFAYYNHVKTNGFSVIEEYKNQCNALKHTSSGCSAHGFGILSCCMCSSSQGKLSIVSTLLFWAVTLVLYRTNIRQ